MYDDALIRPWFESAVERVPGLSLFDAHAHIGFNDPDGLGLSARELIETMEAIHARSVVTPLHEPDGYPSRTTACWKSASDRPGGLCRSVGSTRTATGPARLAAAWKGARGRKLHPARNG